MFKHNESAFVEVFSPEFFAWEARSDTQGFVMQLKNAISYITDQLATASAES